MALITSAASGNFNATSTWTGGVIPGVGDEARASVGHTITLTDNATCAEISNAGTGKFVINGGVTLSATVSIKSTTASLLEFNSASPAICYIVGNVTASTTNALIYGINNLSSGTVNVTGSATGSSGANSAAINNNSGGIVNVTGNVSGANSAAVRNNASGTIIVVGNVEATTGSGNGILNASTGVVQVVGAITASTSVPAISSTNASSVVRVSGSFIHAVNGQVPVNSSKILLWSTPSNSMTRYALNGIGTYVDMFTADNSLGQANPSDVRTGVSYASGSLTGSLTVPVRGTISYGVTYGPAMPFTATRSGTTATATLAYSHPYQVGDTFTVTGAFFSDWNGDYTVASVVSGTSITFSVPATLPAATGAGAVLQTKGAAVLDGASVASAVWSAAARTLTSASGPTATEIRQEMDANSTKLANLDATISSRLAPSGTLATVTTLTNAPTVPTASAIATQVRTELATELARVDAAVSTRLASSVSTNITAIKAKTDLLNTDRLAQCATTSIVGSLIAQSNS
jgi:hypothetical protein